MIGRKRRNGIDAEGRQIVGKLADTGVNHRGRLEPTACWHWKADAHVYRIFYLANSWKIKVVDIKLLFEPWDIGIEPLMHEFVIDGFA